MSVKLVFVPIQTQMCRFMETFTEETIFELYDGNAGKSNRKDRKNLKPTEIIETMLQALGLSNNETQVYLYLALSKERKASEISEALSLHRTNTYRVLGDLEKKGLVSSVFEKPLKFIAAPFEQAVDTLIETKKLRIQKLEKKKKAIVNVWLSIPKPEIAEQHKEVFQILEGEEQMQRPHMGQRKRHSRRQTRSSKHRRKPPQNHKSRQKNPDRRKTDKRTRLRRLPRNG